MKQCNPMYLFADIATHAYSKSLRGYFSGLDNDIVPVVVEFKSVAYVTNGTLRLTAQGLRIWENQNHIGTPVQSLTMTNCVTPFERTLYVERDSLSHSQVDECRLALEWLECTDQALGCATNCITAIKPEMRLVNSDMRSPLPTCPISQQILDELNDIYSQMGIRFSVVDRGAVMEKNAFSVSSSNSPGPWLKDEYCSNDDSISLFVVDNIIGTNAFTDRLFGIVFVGYGFATQTLAHEIGHYLGADDVYVSSSEIDDQLPDVSVSGAFERKHMTDADWNNGTGQRFYRCGELHSDVIKRLLMYGFYTETSLDIPHSRIVGVGFTDDGENFEVRQVKVGREAMSEGGGVL